MAKKKAARKETNARGGEVTKSAEIREVLQANEGIATKDVMRILAEKGITVSSAHVSNQKARLLRRARPGRRVGRPKGSVSATRSSNASTSQFEDAVMEVKRVTDKVGLAEAQRALNLLARLGG